MRESIAAKGTKGSERFVKEESRTHPGLFHTVDLDREFCSCPAMVRCHHIKKHQCIYCDGLGTFISYPKLCTCSHCGGSGRAS